MGGFPRINWPKIPPPKPIHIPAIHIPAPPKPKPVAIHLPAFKPINIPKPRPIHLPPPIDIPKPKIDMRALQQAVGIIGGAVSATPVGKLLMMGVTGISDAAAGGKATNYLNDGRSVNSTLSMLPGGALAQRVANLASDGKSGAALAKTVPDPVHLAIHDIKVIAETVATNPGNTLSATKALAADNRAALVTVFANDARAVAPSIAAPTVLSRALVEPGKVSLFTVVAAVVAPASALAAAPLNTLSFVAPEPLKASLIPVVALAASAPALAFSTLSPVLSPMQAAITPVVEKVSTLAYDPLATVVKPLVGSTLPTVPPAPSSLLPSTVAVVALDTAPRNTLSAATKTTTAIVSAPVLAPGASTLSRGIAHSEPSIDFGSYLPAAGVLGVLAVMLL